MTDVPLSTEHQQMVEELLARLTAYQLDHYQPATGWPKTSLAVDVRQSLDKIPQLADKVHGHTTNDVEGLEDLIDGKVATKAPLSHRHTLQDLDGVSNASSANTVPLRDSKGLFPVATPTSASHPTTKAYVDQALTKKSESVHTHLVSDVQGLQSVLDSKASTQHSHNIESIAGLTEAINARVVQAGSTKADLSSGLVPMSQLPSLPISKITGLETRLVGKADLVAGKVPKSQLPPVEASEVVGLSELVGETSGGVPLEGGLVPERFLPQTVFNSLTKVSSVSALYQLTPSEVQPGDVAIISSGVETGTYHLTGSDPTSPSSWTKYPIPLSVQSVNGLSGNVVLTPQLVGARPAGAIPQSDVTGLTSSLDQKADKTQLTNYATKTDVSDAETRVQEQQHSYPPVNYVSTARLTALSGQQSVDGQLTPVGSKVLLTAQSSSSQNGIWVVSTGSWYRDASMPEGSRVPRGALVPVSQGTSEANTLWQMKSTTSAVVGTSALSWSKVLGGGSGSEGVSFETGAGLQLVDGTLSVKQGTGIIVNSSGVSLNTDGLMRKFAAVVPHGSSVATVTHNLNTRDVYVSIVEVSTGDIVLAGVTVTGVNSVAIEFGTAPTSGQYRAVVFG